MRITFVITAYNYGLYVQRAVRSCLNQQILADQVEVIVVDDASDDNTEEILQPFMSDRRFNYIRNSVNKGVAAAANIGFRLASGQFVTRVDADDFVAENFAFFLVNFLEFNHDLLGVACDYVLIDDNEETIERRRPDQDPIACGILYRKDLLVLHGLYDENLRHCEEDELRVRLGDDYRVERLGMPLYRYRMHNNNKTKQPEYKKVVKRFR